MFYFCLASLQNFFLLNSVFLNHFLYFIQFVFLSSSVHNSEHNWNCYFEILLCAVPRLLFLGPITMKLIFGGDILS